MIIYEYNQSQKEISWLFISVEAVDDIPLLLPIFVVSIVLLRCVFMWDLGQMEATKQILHGVQ